MTELLDIQTKINLIKQNLEVQKILQGLPVKKSCHSCEHYRDGCALADFAEPPEEIKKEGCEKWQELDFIPF